MSINETVKLRKMRIPEDYEQIADLFNLIEPGSTTVTSLKEEDLQVPSSSNLTVNNNGLLIGFGRTRVVVENAGGHIIGYGACFRAPWTEPGTVGSTFCVHPEFRTQGIGEMILLYIEQWAKTHQASSLTSIVMDWIEESLPFAQKRGFILDAHIFELQLDLDQFNLSNYEILVDELKHSGIRFITFADVLGKESEKKLYELFAETSKDNPGQYDNVDPFEEWKKEFFLTKYYRADWIFIAMDSENFVGVSQLLTTDDEGVVYTNYTGVKKEYRHRGIGKALKVISINALKSEGIKIITTDSEENNGPMQHINKSFGFRSGHEHYRILKQLK